MTVLKGLLFLITYVVLLLSSNLGFGQIESRLTERIIYTVRFDENSKKEGGLYNHLESPVKVKLINQFCDLVKTGKLSASYYWGDKIGVLPSYYNTVRKELAESYFDWNDSMVYHSDIKKHSKKHEAKRNNQVYRNLINGLSFQEQWYFDKINNTFRKKVEGVILFEDQYTHDIGMTCNYYIPLADTSANEYYPENFVCKIIYDVPITKSGNNNCNDYNWWYNYLESSKRERFFRLLESKAIIDTVSPIKVYNGSFPYDTLIQRTGYWNTGLAEYFHGRSNWYSGDPLMFGMTDKKIQACCYELSDWTTITKIRFNEEWYFDQRKYRFEKKVLGIGMIVDTFDEKGNKTGEKCLIYYKLNN